MKLLFIVSLILISTLFCFSDEKDAESKDKIKVEKEASKEFILKLIKELGHDNFKIREEATNNLYIHGVKFKKLLSEKLKDTDDIEVQERIKVIIFKSKEKLNQLSKDLVDQSLNESYKGNYEIALSKCLKALEYTPNYHRAITQYSKVQMILGNYKLATEHYEKYVNSIKLPNSEKEHEILTLTDYCIKGGEFKKAQLYLEKALPTSRYSDRILRNLSLVYEYSNQPEKAKNTILKLIKANNNAGNFTQSLAWFHIRKNQSKEALEVFKKRFELKKNKNDFNRDDILNRYYNNEPKKALSAVTLLILGTVDQFRDSKKLAFKNIKGNHILFSCIWFYLSHSNKDKTISQAHTEVFKIWYSKIEEKDKAIWPLPLLGYFGGVLADKDFFNSANAKSHYQTRKNLCEAYYYAGLKALTLNKKKKAHEFFKKSIEQKVYDFIETTGSYYELNKK